MSKMSKNFKADLLLGIFVATIISVNMVGNKTTTIEVLNYPVNFSVGLFLFPLTFFILDAISEVFGKSRAKEFMYIGLVCQAIVTIFIALAVWVPPSARFLPDNPAYVATLQSSVRIAIASIIAYFLSQLGDIASFFFLKNKTGEKFLWLRSDVSTSISQLIDTFLYMLLAFYKLNEKYTLWFVVQITIPYYLTKLFLAWFGTPVIYLIVKWLKPSNTNQPDSA